MWRNSLPTHARFIALVLKEDRESALQFMATSYITLYRKQKNIIRGTLTTAAPVSAETERKVKASGREENSWFCRVQHRGEP